MGINTLYKYRVAAMVANKLKRFNHNDVKAIHEGVTTGILKNNTAWEVTGLQPGWSNHNVLTLLYPQNIVTNVQGHFDQPERRSRSQYGLQTLRTFVSESLQVHFWATTMLWLWPQNSMRSHYNRWQNFRILMEAVDFLPDIQWLLSAGSCYIVRCSGLLVLH